MHSKGTCSLCQAKCHAHQGACKQPTHAGTTQAVLCSNVLYDAKMHVAQHELHHHTTPMASRQHSQISVPVSMLIGWQEEIEKNLRWVVTKAEGWQDSQQCVWVPWCVCLHVSELMTKCDRYWKFFLKKSRNESEKTAQQWMAPEVKHQSLGSMCENNASLHHIKYE